jgi:hypothetical protein
MKGRRRKVAGKRRGGYVRKRECFVLSLYYCCTYCCITAVLGKRRGGYVRKRQALSLYYCFTYRCFTAALLLLYCCFTAALLVRVLQETRTWCGTATGGRRPRGSSAEVAAGRRSKAAVKQQ